MTEKQPQAGEDIHDKPLVGIVLMLLAMAALGGMDVISKLLAADHSGWQIAWGRYTFHFVPMLLLAGPWRVNRLLRTANPWLQIIRGSVLAATGLFFVLAFSLMPLADAVAISFVGPLIMVVLGAVFLGERVGLQRLVAVLLGFIGMLVMVWPSGGIFELGAIFAFAAALFGAVGFAMTRYMRAEDPWTTLFYTALVGFVLLSAGVPFAWTTPDLTAWLQMAAMGIGGLIAHTLIIYAFRHASASLLAPYNYSLLIWALFYGWLVFGQLPGARIAAGALLIVAAGLYVWHREKQSGLPG